MKLLACRLYITQFNSCNRSCIAPITSYFYNKNTSYILSTVKFNDNIVKVVLDEEFLVSEEKYDIFTSKKETNDFLKLEPEVE